MSLEEAELSLSRKDNHVHLNSAFYAARLIHPRHKRLGPFCPSSTPLLIIDDGVRVMHLPRGPPPSPPHQCTSSSEAEAEAGSEAEARHLRLAIILNSAPRILATAPLSKERQVYAGDLHALKLPPTWWWEWGGSRRRRGATHDPEKGMAMVMVMGGRQECRSVCWARDAGCSNRQLGPISHPGIFDMKALDEALNDQLTSFR
ncbi:hypothetical protein R3P38DRAFT_2804190 [Favolaschia claudopus]|uniref:Uncharacterized protein n=1 Tax=Favolaschia claudopus TaxID=2862362 RepID=A0AAV9ZQX7_9AGAR